MLILMDMLLKPLIPYVLVENLREDKLMLSLLPTTLSSLPQELSLSEHPIKMLPQILLKSAKLMELNQFKVFFPTKLRNIWLMEMKSLSTKRLQNKESKTGNSPQEMSSVLMFLPLLEKVWEKNLKLELLYIKEKWTYNIPLNLSTLELSSL